jgi:hypothetical protein
MALLLAAFVAVILVTLTAYVGTYCWMSVRVDGQRTNLAGQRIEFAERIFRYQWQVAMYGPATRVESMLTGQEVSAHRWEEYVSP